MAKISNESLKQLFTEARSQNGWLDKEVTNEQLHEIYELMKSNFICSLGHGDSTKVFARLPRLSFDEACKIV